MADPVSWLLIEPGWRAEAGDGSDVGRVLEVVGDSSHDIFDGLVVASGPLASPRYVPAEQVGTIVEGTVRLNLTADAVAALPEYSEPAETIEVEPEKAPIGRRLEADVVSSDHRGRIGLLRRVALWFGLAGKR